MTREHANRALVNAMRKHGATAISKATKLLVAAHRTRKAAVTLMVENGKTVLRIYEGCNGINVMIVFIAFIISFGGISKRGALFMSAGILMIHLANVIRIALLFWVAKHHETWFYYVHKYIFTAALYVIVLLLWWVWVSKMIKTNDRAKQQA